MPTLPTLKAKVDSVTVVNQFLGLNKGLHINDAEFSDMQNMTNDYFPVVSSRRKRGFVRALTKPQGMVGGDQLILVDNNKLYIDHTLKYQLASTDAERSMVLIGALLCIFPDKKIYNIITGVMSDMENTKTSAGTVTIRMSKLDGTDIDSITWIGDSAPTNTSTYPYWMDTSQKTAVLKMYNSTYSSWASVGTSYIKIQSTGIGVGFKAYDAIKMSGIRHNGYNDQDLNQTNIAYKVADDYVIIAGIIDSVRTQTEEVTFSRPVPSMDYICELDNRIWGCSSENHEVYACKQGDPTNWNCYAGLDSDSYAATIGSQGEFTGCTSYGGYAFFFKEDGFHKLYGTKPSNYELVWKPGRGVQRGCSKSISVVDEVLMYKSRDAVCAYDGSVDTISEKLGVRPYYDAIAVGYRHKYYISMRDEDYNFRLYVYDMTKGTWVVEDINKPKYMTYADNGTYFVDRDDNLWVINNEKIYKKFFPNQIDLDVQYRYPQTTSLYPGDIIGGETEEPFEWNITTGDLGLDNPYNKYLKRINVRMQLDSQSKILIEIEYDSSGEWEHVTEYYSNKKRSYDIPISVRRADHVRLRISGYGEVKIYSIAKAVEAGSGDSSGEN